MRDLLREAHRFSPRLAQWLQAVGEQPFMFTAQEHPIMHSSYNHVHLGLLEYEAARHPRLTLAFRTRVVSFLFERWKQRLKGYRPYWEAGYRLYLYEDSAPTLSVVAETAYGFPYGGHPVFVHSAAEVLQCYVGSSWPFASSRAPNPDVLLAALRRHQGALGSTANSLQMTTAVLRQEIERFDLQDAVNRVRKNAHRRRAHFLTAHDLQASLPYRIYELKLPAWY